MLCPQNGIAERHRLALLVRLAPFAPARSRGLACLFYALLGAQLRRGRLTSAPPRFAYTRSQTTFSEPVARRDDRADESDRGSG